jgi:hypothetical protein
MKGGISEMFRKLLVAIGATIASAAAMTPAAAELLSKGAGLPFGTLGAFGAFGCGFSVGFPWMGGLCVGPGLFGFGIPFWW